VNSKETVVPYRNQQQRASDSQSGKPSSARGFTLIELVVVVAIAALLAAMAIPLVQSTLQVYALRSGVSSLTGVIQATRYQAIYHGCPYQLAFTAGTYSYTTASMAPATGGTACLAAFSAPSAAIPLTGRRVALGGNVTIVFHPSGLVQSSTGTAVAPITLTYPGLPTETITVSNYGRVLVTP
jgi:prepilin-type N-terminal cleavage/methylation domain-containing protein